MNATSTNGRAALVAANGRARRPAEPPQGDFSHAEAQRGGERRDCCQCENVANTQSQYPIGTGNTSTTATFSSLPNGWEVRPLRAFLRSVSVRNRPDEQLLSVTREEGVIVRDVSSKEENHNYIPEDLSNYKFVEEGQFVINKMKSWQGSYGVSAYDGLVSPAYFVYDLDFPCKEFFNLAIRSKTYVQYFQRFSKGIRVDQWDLMPEALKLIPFAYPPLPEQKAIVAYLDAETGRIDKAIAAEEKMIALLQERREIVINEAVTPHDGWEMKPLRSFLCEVRELSKTGEELPLSLTANAGIVPFSEKSNRTLENDTYVGTKIVRKGQIVFNRFRARLFAVSGYDGLVSPDYAVFTVSKDVAAKFLVALFGTSRFKQRLNLLASGIGDGFSRVYAGDLLRLKISLPPLPEQEAIVERLDRETGKIDRAIEVKRRQIELLRERRQIVIDEVVTGKVKVA